MFSTTTLYKLQNNNIDTHALLSHLAQADKATQWVLFDCQVVDKTFFTRLFLVRLLTFILKQRIG